MGFFKNDWVANHLLTDRSDREGEYESWDVQNYSWKEGICKLEYLVSYMAQQNGIAERQHRYLMEMARTMLI